MLLIWLYEVVAGNLGRVCTIPYLDGFDMRRFGRYCTYMYVVYGSAFFTYVDECGHIIKPTCLYIY